MRLIRKRAIALLIIATITGTATVFAVNVSSSCIIQSHGRISYTRQTFDFNHDGKVGIVDAAIVARAFGCCAGDENWNPSLDLNGDGKVGEADLSMIACSFWGG